MTYVLGNKSLFEVLKEYSKKEIVFGLKVLHEDKRIIYLKKQFGEKFLGLTKTQLIYYERVKLESFLTDLESFLSCNRLLRNELSDAEIERFWKEKTLEEILEFAICYNKYSALIGEKNLFQAYKKMFEQTSCNFKNYVEDLEKSIKKKAIEEPLKDKKNFMKKGKLVIPYILKEEEKESVETKKQIFLSKSFDSNFANYLKKHYETVFFQIYQYLFAEEKTEEVIKLLKLDFKTYFKYLTRITEDYKIYLLNQKDEKEKVFNTIKYQKNQSIKKNDENQKVNADDEKEKEKLETKQQNILSKSSEPNSSYSIKEKKNKISFNEPIKKSKQRPKNFTIYFKEDASKIKLALHYQSYFSPKGYEVFSKIYDKETLLLKEGTLTLSEKSVYQLFLRKVKELVATKSKEELVVMNENLKITKPILKKPHEFVTYFFTSKMSEQEKEEIFKKMFLAIDYYKIHSQKSYDSYRKFYNEKGIYQITESVTNKDHTNFIHFKNNIEKIMQTSTIEELKELIDSVSKENFLENFYAYFYKENLKKEEVKEKVDLAIAYFKRSAKECYQVYSSLYDEEGKRRKSPEVKGNEKRKFNLFKEKIEYFITTKTLEEIKEALLEKENAKQLVYGRKMPQNFYEYFVYDYENKSFEEKETIQVRIQFLLNRYQYLNGYASYSKFYDEQGKKVPDVAYLEKEKYNFFNLRKHIIADFEKISEDETILKFYFLSFNPNEVMQNLGVTKEDFLACLLRNLDVFPSVEPILNYLIEEEKISVKKILETPYFGKNMCFLNEGERQLIYLKLLSKKKKNLTPEKISEMLQLDTEFVLNYQPFYVQENNFSSLRILK